MRFFVGLLVATALPNSGPSHDGLGGDISPSRHAGCHTREHGTTFAGGLPFQAQFGTVYSTNITPDKETGIGT